jgi:hypothetical protein
MLRKLSPLAVLVFALVPWRPAYAQDPQPSLGEVARQARKDKGKNAAAPKKVITEDSLPSGKALGGLNDFGGAQGSGDDSSAMAKGLAGLDRAEAALNKLAPLDRATLAKAALLDNDVDFPGRRSWEDKLYAAKEQYVSHGRELFGEMRKILADVQSLKSSQAGQGKLGANDPHAQEMIRRIQELVQDAVRTDSAYQSVVMEGWDRAKQAKR